MRLLKSIPAVRVLAVTLCWGSIAWAQRPHPPKPPARSPANPNKVGKPGKGPAAGPARNGSPVQEFLHMSPDQRDKALKNLPPQRRENILKRLNQYDQAPPEQKARLERLWSLPPERQQEIRESMRELRDMPVERRRPINQQLRRLQTMTPEEREAYFNSPEFKNQFSPREQETMRDLSDILPPNGF